MMLLSKSEQDKDQQTKSKYDHNKWESVYFSFPAATVFVGLLYLLKCSSCIPFSFKNLITDDIQIFTLEVHHLLALFSYVVHIQQLLLSLLQRNILLTKQLAFNLVIVFSHLFSCYRMLSWPLLLLWQLLNVRLPPVISRIRSVPNVSLVLWCFMRHFVIWLLRQGF